MGTILRFDKFDLDTRTLELRRLGALVALRPQPCRLLVCLARTPGELMTRDELRSRLWPAGTFVQFNQGLNSCMKQIRGALGDTRDRPRFIETLPRRGYRFLLPVTEVTGATTPVGRPRVAVLPFIAIDAPADAGAPLVTAGFTEELRSRLASLRPGHLAVIASVPAEPTHGRATGGRDLDADFLVQGSIRRSGAQLRVAVQLIDLRDRQHVWARSYERAIADPLLWQDEAAVTIARDIAGTFRLSAAS
jgi:TolB-like protein